MHDSEIDRRLEEMSDDLVDKLTCPSCEASLTKVDVVEILSPDDMELKSAETYKNLLGGAGTLGAVGALAGPAGVVVGGVVGAAVGGGRGLARDELRRVQVQCPNCGHDDSAL